MIITFLNLPHWKLNYIEIETKKIRGHCALFKAPNVYSEHIINIHFISLSNPLHAKKKNYIYIQFLAGVPSCESGDTKLWIWPKIYITGEVVTLEVPIVTNVNFLLMISIECQAIRLWELIKWSPKGKCLDLLSNSLNLFLKEMYRDQFGEFVCGYWGLKG